MGLEFLAEVGIYFLRICLIVDNPLLEAKSKNLQSKVTIKKVFHHIRSCYSAIQ